MRTCDGRIRPRSARATFVSHLLSARLVLICVWGEETVCFIGPAVSSPEPSVRFTSRFKSDPFKIHLISGRAGVTSCHFRKGLGNV